MIAIPYYETSNFVFSNFSAHAVKYKGVAYPTAEHAFHAQKFDNEMLRNQLRDCPSPVAAWELGKKLKPKRRSDWNSVKVDILTEIIRCKTEQNADVREALLATGDEEIVEINPNDDFWGNGANGDGQNQTGKILMKIRDEISRKA